MNPYVKTPVVGNYLDIMVGLNLESRLDDEEYEIPPEYNYRPDLLANELYGDPTLYFVFIKRNMDIMEDPVFDFTTGKIIKLPAIDAVRNMK